MMRILCLSHDPLPDIRVEKSAYTAEKNGHATFFAGPQVRSLALPLHTFDKTFALPFNRKANLRIPPYWNSLKKSLRKTITECKPDVIHAHNVIAGKLASEFDIPFVYDDHEYWSISMKAIEKTKSYHIFSLRYKRWLLSRWEKKILKKASAIITTAETVANEFQKNNDHVFVVPNFPSLVETKAMQIRDTEKNHLSSVYVGGDCTHPQPSPERNATGLIDVFDQNEVGTLTIVGDNRLASRRNVVSLGFLSHQEMLTELTKHHIGLLPWKKHWLHRYKHPNKPYQYAHAGLLTIAASDMSNVIDNLKKYIKTFENYKDLVELLLYYKDNIEEIVRLREEVRKYALTNLIWEKTEGRILEAYSKC